MRCYSIIFISLISFTVITGLGCRGSNPILSDISDPGYSQVIYGSRMMARFDPDSGFVWLAAPPGIIKPDSEVAVTTSDGASRQLSTYPDGRFLYRFPGNEDSFCIVTWTDTNETSHTQTIVVTDPDDDVTANIRSTGLYCNRIFEYKGTTWVVNSGDDELAVHDTDSLVKLASDIDLPEFSNPWEADFSSPTSGLITTLFNGVFSFDIQTGHTPAITTEGFREFASPNGVFIAGMGGWVTNTNPISYFPSEHGQGWISLINVETGSVVSEINTPWLNPQYVIADRNYLYVSCTGTVDFVPPDYFANAVTGGGIMVLNLSTREIVNTFDLGLCAPGPLALSPDKRYLYAGSGVAANLYRIDLHQGIIINGPDNPIVISDFPGSFIPFISEMGTGLIATASFNDDVLRFVDSYTGELDPYPFFKPVKLHPGEPEAKWGPQDGVFTKRNGESGLLFITTINGAFHWLEI